ncbi:MAG: LysR family transcriptional regulator [Sphingomonas sp.]|jgi:DNA-binding transcriptional LysR family regulator
MEVFVEAVDRGSFAAASRVLGLSPSAVSKVIGRIEARLGTGLLIRSTRSLHLTQEGEIYLRRARNVLAEIDDTERTIASGACSTPRGLLRINASIPIAHCAVTPLLPAFLARYPEIEIDLSLSDGMVDLIENKTDVAIRVGPMQDSSLKARKLLESRNVVVAAPAYLAESPPLETPVDLPSHRCIAFNFRRAMDEWPFRHSDDGMMTYAAPKGRIRVNNGETVRQLAIAGMGLARMARFHVQPDIEAGRLVPVLEAFNPGDTDVMSAVYVGHDHLAARIRAFVDFLAEHMAIGEPDPVQ